MLRLRYRHVCFSIFWLNFNFTSLIRIRNTILDSIRFVRGFGVFFSLASNNSTGIARSSSALNIYLFNFFSMLPSFSHSSSLSVFFFCFFLPLLLVCCYFLFSISFFFTKHRLDLLLGLLAGLRSLAAVLLMFITQEMKRDFFMIFSSELRQSRILAVFLRSKRSLLCCCVAAFPNFSFYDGFSPLWRRWREKRDFFWLVSWLICEMMMTKRRIDQKRIVKNHEPSSVERDSLACICLIDHFQIFFPSKKQNRSLRRFFPSFHLCSLLGTTSPFYLCQRCVAPTLRLRF